MREIFLDILEINIVVTPMILLLMAFSGKLRRVYGAKWLKALWIILALRLAIPYNFTLPFVEIRLLELPASEWELMVEADESVDVGAQNEVLFDAEVYDEENIDTGVYGKEAYGAETYDTGIYNADSYGTGAYNTENSIGVNNAGEYRENNFNEEGFGAYTAGGQGAGQDIRISGMGNQGIDGQRTRSVDVPMLLVRGIILLWADGGLISFLYYVVSYLLFFTGIRKTIRPLKDSELRQRIYRLQRSQMKKRVLPVYLCKRIPSPMIVGLFCPKLLLPLKEEPWKEDELSLVVSHELYHYRQKDLWLKLLMLLAQSINWFNPAVYGMRRRFFEEMELTCDSAVLEEKGADVRERYARLMLSFCKRKNRTSSRSLTVFSTGFQGDKKRLQNRIDCMMDEKRKKKGIFIVVVMLFLVVAMGLMFSCGYGSGEGSAENTPQENLDDSKADGIDSNGGQTVSMDADADSHLATKEEDQSVGTDIEEEPFDYNNEYNEMLRRYGEDTYISREDGIYRIGSEEEEETCVFENFYEIRRGMELYGDALYFCGSCLRGEEEQATIYRMDLETLAVKDLLAAFSSNFEVLFGISIYEGNLYVAQGSSARIGFALDEEGQISGTLDETAEDFLFHEYNEYMELYSELYVTSFDNQEIWQELKQKYQALIDAAACKKMLNGCQVVQRYKDELLNRIYLETPEGEYEFLCDMVGYPPIVTETGLYYAADESGDIWYMDYETKQREKVYEREPEALDEILLVNYDQTYLYFTRSRYMGTAEDGSGIMEDYLMRVPRQRGEAEEIFELDEGMNTLYLQSRSAIDENYIYFGDGQRRSLIPEK